MAIAGYDVVTGAFGYTGKYITRRLLAMGRGVVTLTGHPQRPNPFGGRVTVAPFDFDDQDALAERLRGGDTLYNTYWVRFPHAGVTFERAVRNSRVLVAAGKQAGLRRIVHISITNPSEDSPFPYFRGKALVEKAIREAGISHALIRPTVIFGKEDILINNIAWLLRRFPLFPVPGSGEYRLQPVFVGDVAELAVDAGQRDENLALDAVGPEVFTFDELVRLIARAVRSSAHIIHVPPGLALFLSRLVGYLMRDVVLTREELQGMMAELVLSRGPATAGTRLSEWLAKEAATLGRRYASELGKHYR